MKSVKADGAKGSATFYAAQCHSFGKILLEKREDTQYRACRHHGHGVAETFRRENLPSHQLPDGAGELYICFKIVMPLCKPVLASIGFGLDSGYAITPITSTARKVEAAVKIMVVR